MARPPRKCLKCSFPLPPFAEVEFRGNRPFCPRCVDLCRIPDCKSARGSVYVDAGLCTPCGIAKQRRRMGEKRCKNCSSSMVRGETRAQLCRACALSMVSVWEKRSWERRLLKRIAAGKLCRDCMAVIPYGQARYCASCKTARAVTRNRSNAKEQKYKRRALKMGQEATFTKQDWVDLLILFDSRCAFCGKKSAELTEEHLLPLTRGGPHSAGNVVPACLHCNVCKNFKTPLEWFMFPS